jgi:hypothetical protein
MKNYGRPIIAIAMCFLLCVNSRAQSNPLSLERHGDRLIVTAPQWHFVSKKDVGKLQNGSTIVCVLTLTLVPAHSRKQTYRAKFVISYDLWEENYSVSSIPDGRKASRLAIAMAETWCLENLPVPIRSIPERQSFAIRLECFIQEDECREDEKGKSGSNPIFNELVEIFSRKKQEEPLRMEIAGGPFRLEDLKISR